MTYCVVIPVYMSMDRLTKDEMFSIQRAIMVLKNRSFFLVHPKKLRNQAI